MRGDGVVVICLVALIVAVPAMSPPTSSFALPSGGSVGSMGGPGSTGGSLMPEPPSQPKEPATVRVDISAEEFSSLCVSNIGLANSTYYSILTETPTTKRDLLRIVNTGDIIFSNLQMMAGLFEDVHPSEAMRDAATQCKLQATGVGASVLLDQALYQAASALASAPTEDLIDERRFERLMTTFRRSGVTLTDPAQRERVKTLTIEIETLSSQYSVNVNNDTKTITVAASDSASLAGLPSDFLTARTAGGLVKITTDYPDFVPAMKRAKSAELRKELYLAFNQRAADKNIEILEQVLAKRHEMATLLGYRSWAHYATETMMIEDEVKAEEFMGGVIGITTDSMTRDLALMLALKQEDVPTATHLESYDASYYNYIALQRYFDINDTEVRSYFTYRTALQGVLDTASELFGVTFVKTTGKTWHADVDIYNVFWASDSAKTNQIGKIYLDMFPRESKYKHAAQFPMRSGVEGVQMPEGCLVCNFAQTGPMEFGDVRTLFHEFGHLMHHVIGGQEKRYIEFSGVATEWDFVEAPSQMLEEWVYSNLTLPRFAVHAETGQPIPNKLIDKLKRANLFGRGVHARQQMFYGQLSLQLHKTPGVNSTSKMIELQESLAPYPYVPNTYFHASFGHLMGYSSNYYTYMWSEAQALHMYDVFEKAPSILDPATALKYRESVIRPGGNKPASHLVFDFTDKPFSLDALNRHLMQDPLASTTA